MNYVKKLGVLAWLALGVASLARAEPLPEQFSPFITAKAQGKTMDEALTNLKRAIGENNYIFIREQPIDRGLVTAGNEDRQIMIVYFCNFGMLATTLDVDKHIGVYLPCRVTLIQEEDGVRMVALNPKFMGATLGEDSLSEVCDKLTGDYHNIIAEAVL